MSDIIFNLFMVLAVVAGAIFAYIIMKDKGVINKSDKRPVENYMVKGEINEKDLVDKSKLQDLFGIDHVDDNNIVRMLKGGGMRVIFSISTPDIYLLNEEEQQMFENSLLNIALSLNFPVQFFTTTRKIETKKSSQKLIDTIGSPDAKVSPHLRDYARMLYSQLEAIEQNRRVNEIKNYCIVGVSGIYDERRARNELSSRVETIVKGFTSAKIKTEVLEKDKILQLLCDVLNRGDNISVEKLREGDVFGMYSKGMSMEGGRSNG